MRDRGELEGVATAETAATFTLSFCLSAAGIGKGWLLLCLIAHHPFFFWSLIFSDKVGGGGFGLVGPSGGGE